MNFMGDKERKLNNISLQAEIVTAINTLVDAKNINPNSENYKSALLNLAKILADKPDALKMISELQKDK